jgi:cob(I)alamin adenosyltransferase
MVVLSKIYTRTGDGGQTRLGDNTPVAKTDLRLAAYAQVDEANAAIGVAIAMGDLPEEVVAVLTRVQHDLFDVGADLCTPVVDEPEFPPLRVEADYVTRLEQACDVFGDPLPTLRSFVLPGGTRGAALLHVARTVTRRAERAGWAAMEEHGDSMNPLALTYLNRLSDLLFILSRVANLPPNGGVGDVLWVPGANRT